MQTKITELKKKNKRLIIHKNLMYLSEYTLMLTKFYEFIESKYIYYII